MLRRLAHAMLLTTTAALATVSTSQAADVELSLSDSMAELLLADRITNTETQGTRYGGSFMFNDDSDLLGTAFLGVSNRGSGRWQPVTFGVGGKAFLADLDRPGKTVGALGLGGDISVGIPANIPMAVVFQAYLSPNITTTGNAKRVTEAMVRLEAEVTRGAHAFIGYRQIKVRSDDFRDVNVDDGLHAGIRLRF